MTTELMNSMSTAYNEIVDWGLSSLNVVLPIAIGIFAIMFIWFLVTKFFARFLVKKWGNDADRDFEENYSDGSDDDDDDD